MSDVPAFDADKAAAGELELSTGARLWATLVEMDNACGLVQQGLMDRAGEMVVETGILAINATSPPAADWLGVRISFTELPPAPELTGNAVADQGLHLVPIVRIVGGFGRAGRLFLDGDHEGAGRALAEPEAEGAAMMRAPAAPWPSPKRRGERARGGIGRGAAGRQGAVVEGRRGGSAS